MLCTSQLNVDMLSLPNNSNLTDLNFDVLWENVIHITIFTIAGIVAIVTGTISVITVLKCMGLQNNFYNIYAGVALSDVIMGIAYVVTAVRRFHRHLFGDRRHSDRWHCCLESMVLYFSQTLALYMVFALTINRTVSILKLVRKPNLAPSESPIESISLIVFAWSMSLFETGYMLVQGYTLKSDIIPGCETASCWLPSSYSITLYCHLSISSIVIFLNIILILIVACVLHLKNHHTESKVIRVLTVMVLSHATSHAGSRLGLLVILLKSGRNPELTQVGLALRNLIVVNGALHFFIFYFTSSEFKSAVKKLFSRSAEELQLLQERKKRRPNRILPGEERESLL